MEPNPAQLQHQRHAEEATKNSVASMDTEHVKPVIYYSRLNGNTFVFTDGTVAKFVNGQYITDRAWEISQLDALCKLPHNVLICKEEVPVQNPTDVVIMRELPGSDPGGGGGHVHANNPHTGMVSSAQLAALAAMSTRK